MRTSRSLLCIRTAPHAYTRTCLLVVSLGTLQRDTIRVAAVEEWLTLHCEADAVSVGRVPTTCGLRAID